MEIKKIVITGGPCAGKSTALNWIKESCTCMGYTVLFVPETATEFITGGVAPWTCGTNLDYQKCQMDLQLMKEYLFLRAAETMPKEKILIVCDRGALDNHAYMNEQEFAEALDHVEFTEEELLARYDAVFHLETAAKEGEFYYTTANNEARIETCEEAIALDERLMSAWNKHPRHTVIHHAENFGKKMEELISALGEFLENR